MFYEFSHRHASCTVDGVSDSVILSRDSKSTSIISREYLYNGLFSSSSSVKPGSLIETNNSFLVQTLRSTIEKDKYCSMIKTNVLVEVRRMTQQYDENDNPIGDAEFNPVQSNVIAFSQYVTADLRQKKVGLLPSTEYILLMQTTIDVRRPQDGSLIEPDRIVLKDRNYQVDAIDDIKYPNLFYIQLSEDTR